MGNHYIRLTGRAQGGFSCCFRAGLTLEAEPVRTGPGKATAAVEQYQHEACRLPVSGTLETGV